jgi:hypothetical protein
VLGHGFVLFFLFVTERSDVQEVGFILAHGFRGSVHGYLALLLWACEWGGTASWRSWHRGPELLASWWPESRGAERGSGQDISLPSPCVLSTDTGSPGTGLLSRH